MNNADALSSCGVWFVFFWGFHDISKGEVELRCCFSKNQASRDGCYLWESQRGIAKIKKRNHQWGFELSCVYLYFRYRWQGLIFRLRCLSFFKALRIVKCGKIEDGFLAIMRLLAWAIQGLRGDSLGVGNIPSLFHDKRCECGNT